METTSPRKIAKTLGLKVYEGKPCLHGHETTRYVRNSDCVKCSYIRKSIAAQQKKAAKKFSKRGRPRKYLELVGPPKPKVNQRYNKTTVIGNWIHRSKNGNKSKLRKTLTVKDYEKLIVTHCPLLGLELTYALYSIKTCPINYATLDKINPSKGYVVGNVQILSSRANTIKSNATLEELKLIVANWNTVVL